jgi:hypothetical protein
MFLAVLTGRTLTSGVVGAGYALNTTQEIMESISIGNWI